MTVLFYVYFLSVQEPVTAGVANPGVPQGHGATTVNGLTPSISRPAVTLFCRGTACGE